MKNIALILILLTTAFAFSSCYLERVEPDALMQDLIHELSYTGTVYSTKYKEGEVGCITDTLRKQLFTNLDIVPEEYAVYLYSGLDFVCEVGMLSSLGKPDKADILNLCRERIAFLSSLTSGTGDVIIYRGIVIYYFSTDGKIKDAIEKIT